MKNLLSCFGRFTTPFSSVRVKDEDILKVSGYCRRIFSTSEGEIVMKHLINEFELDGQTGCLSQDEANYRAGQQDVIKYILSLISED